MDVLSKSIASSLPSTQSARAGGSANVYTGDSARDVRNRAASTEARQTPDEQQGLRRLSNTLDGGELQRDVPRGFYLNIVI